MADISEEDLRQYVLNFLKDFKELMRQGHYFVKGHHKKIQALIALGINARLRDEIILSIGIADYSSGPNPDEYHPGYYWVFGKDIDTIEVYIKLKIVTYNDGNDRAICLSFHPAEHALKYPFRN